jgi:hypothetical protein
MGILVVFDGFGRRKTKPIYSYCVLRDAYCERSLKKQSQFAKERIGVKSVLIMVYGISCKRRQRKNKANSKPNKLVPSAQAIPKAFGFEAATRSCSPMESIRTADSVKCVMTGLSAVCYGQGGHIR